VTGTYIFAAIALVTAGAVIGVLTVVALGIRQEDRRGGFPARPRGWLARLEPSGRDVDADFKRWLVASPARFSAE